MCSEAKEYIGKSFLKFGLINIGVYVNAILIFEKDYLASRVHLIAFPFLSISIMLLIISVQFRMNVLKKFTLPMKD